MSTHCELGENPHKFMEKKVLRDTRMQDRERTEENRVVLLLTPQLDRSEISVCMNVSYMMSSQLRSLFKNLHTHHSFLEYLMYLA